MTLRAAVIGVGNMGLNHARIYASMLDVELVAVCDQNPERSLKVAAQFKCRTETNLRGLLDCKPDVVSVCTPTPSHMAIALACLADGKHVLLEKPVADSPEAGETLVHAAGGLKPVLMIGHIERFNPAVVAVRQMVSDGALGRIFQISTRRLGPFSQVGAQTSVLIDLGVHDLDIIEWVTGQKIGTVYAATLRNVYGPAEDLALGVLKLSGGAVASIMINRLSPVKLRTLTICGERGLLHLDYISQTIQHEPNGMGTEDGHTVYPVPDIVKIEPLRAEIKAFLAAVQGEIPCPVTGAHGLRALKLAEALRYSGTIGLPIQV